MTIKELKLSLSRLPGDLDDLEVIVNFTSENEKLDYDYLAFTAYNEISNEDGGIVFILGTKGAALKRIKDGTLRHVDGNAITPLDENNDELD